MVEKLDPLAKEEAARLAGGAYVGEEDLGMSGEGLGMDEEGFGMDEEVSPWAKKRSSTL